MNKYFILLMFTLGCGTKSADKTTGDIVSDPVTETSLTATADGEPEDFNEFFEKFRIDSAFQIQRIKFPWRLLSADDEGSTVEETQREDWEHSSFYYEDGFAARQTDAYTQEIKNYVDTVKVEIRGVDNGIYVDYEFAKENNRWFLVSGKDYSN